MKNKISIVKAKAHLWFIENVAWFLYNERKLPRYIYELNEVKSKLKALKNVNNK
jgi:hypothetical protein